MNIRGDALGDAGTVREDGASLKPMPLAAQVQPAAPACDKLHAIKWKAIAANRIPGRAEFMPAANNGQREAERGSIFQTEPPGFTDVPRKEREFFGFHCERHLRLRFEIDLHASMGTYKIGAPIGLSGKQSPSYCGDVIRRIKVNE